MHVEPSTSAANPHTASVTPDEWWTLTLAALDRMAAEEIQSMSETDRARYEALRADVGAIPVAAAKALWCRSISSLRINGRTPEVACRWLTDAIDRDAERVLGALADALAGSRPSWQTRR